MTNAILSFHQWNNPSHTEGAQKGSTTPPLSEAQKITHGRRKQFPCMQQIYLCEARYGRMATASPLPIHSHQCVGGWGRRKKIL
ncbi:hypothetical protein CDAR_615141 [Caerostris darwini]|uniref:Uncharacterized protein n=1 Tax=Caerostris darwini TaxID=1538125 RepID=A0AAV4R9P2_9ARAC|nr:hypothetical protein CDAR_615141 [Caerostris darwini]